MPRELEVYRWTCPICSETKASLATMDSMDVEEQARSALVSHVRTRDRGGHGRAGRYPPGFNSDEALDCIEIEGVDEDRHRRMNAAR